MKTERIIKEMARLDGYFLYEGTKGLLGDHAERRSKILPDYMTDHNAVQRLIDKMDDKSMNIYAKYLISSFDLKSNAEFCKATAAQKCEAILKTFKKWED